MFFIQTKQKMKRFKHNLALLLLFLIPVSDALSQETKVMYLSGTDSENTAEWDFMVTDGRKNGEWTTIHVPSNWELQGFGTYNYGHDWRNENRTVAKEKGLYKHEFNVPEDWKGKVIQLVFEGSMTDTRVSVNGKQAGEIHQGAFYRFSYNISDLLKYGEDNLLEVEVSKHSANESVNKAERQADYWIFGGIFRPVFLQVMPEMHISRVAVDAKADGSLKTLINLNEIKNRASIEMLLFDSEGNQVGGSVKKDLEKNQQEVNLAAEFDDIQNWSPENPNLYNLQVNLIRKDEVIHTITEIIGFRTIELRRHDGFYLNGEKIVFKGVNRHSFYPTTGRALSESNHLEDILLMKEMNMNAVRMSHYPPDKRFLELTDSLGLMVQNEIAGWQDGYDSIVGPKVTVSTVVRDHNHPSVVIWNNGNEGGYNLYNEKFFREYDIQDRPVLYPWMLRNGADLHHYPSSDYGTSKYMWGNDPFMPTEFLHGLYDGGHGAALEDYWDRYQASPLHAGGFLWVFTDEAVIRTDKEGVVYDSDGDHAPDGILGPHREKEGSFFTIKEIWSPVQVKPIIINRQWDGNLFVENKFMFTNLNECTFEWKTFSTDFNNGAEELLAEGVAESPNAVPGETALLKTGAADAIDGADIFSFSAFDHNGKELYTWRWPIQQTWEIAESIVSHDADANEEIEVFEDENTITGKVKNLQFTFSLDSGQLQNILKNDEEIGFGNGPIIVGRETEIQGVDWWKDENGNLVVNIETDYKTRYIRMTVLKSGLLLLEADLLNHLWANFDYYGISFEMDENINESITWMGKGPYRVWKNRTKGAEIGVWSKDYNNTITGESFNDLVYPEYKGYHQNLYWAKFHNRNNDFNVISATPNLFFRLFTPGEPSNVLGGTNPPFPEGDISFLYEIPAIGTKFKKPEQLGRASARGFHGGHTGEETYPIKLWFDFR